MGNDVSQAETGEPIVVDVDEKWDGWAQAINSGAGTPMAWRMAAKCSGPRASLA